MWFIGFKKEALDDLAWFRRHDRRLYVKCLDLIQDMSVDPRSGIGKPERLSYVEGEAWSRRVSQKDRCVYSIRDERILISSFRTHYGDH